MLAPETPSTETHPTLRLLAQAHAAGAALVFPNDTAARSARALFDDAQRARGLHVWEPANVLSWSNWLRGLWSGLVVDGLESRLLLNPAQEHLLWRAVIEAAPIATLDAPDALADIAHSAWSLAAAWQALPELARHAHTRDATTFAEWAASFRRVCARQQALSAAMLADALSEHAAAGRLKLTAPISFAGFDEFLPAQTALLEALRTSGAQIEVHSLALDAVEVLPATHFVLKAEDEASELRAAAYWIRRFIEERAAAGLPHRVALIVGDPSAIRAELEPALRSLLAPELEDIAADTSSAPFAFSAGASLASTAIIDTALALLRWLTAALPLERLSSLLLSNYFAPQTDLATFAEFDAFTLREKNLLRPELTIHELRRIATARHADDNGPWTVVAPLLDRMLEAQRELNAGPKQRSFADWMQFFRKFLRTAGWPGGRELNHDEHEALRSWDHVLDLVATLDFRDDRVDLSTALAAIEREAQNAAASATLAAPVQILSPREAAGSLFDALVFIRATDDVFPPTERPHPLLAWTLQSSRAMPGTDAARSAARAEHLAERLIAGAPRIVFTFASHNAEGEQRLSPLLAKRNWPVLSLDDLQLNEAAAPAIAEEIYEDIAPLPPLTSTHISGGARVLKLQAACGFRAFAEMRLNSTEPARHDAGFDRRQSGNVVHDALDYFWKEVKSHDELSKFSPAARNEHLSAAVDFALARQPAAAQPWDESYLRLQRVRTLRLLRSWLAHELTRGPFTVLASESKREIVVGPLRLDVRVDRIDEVRVPNEAGVPTPGLVFIDYKTGAKSSPKDWDLPQPDDPQLPLYTLLHAPEEIQAVTFAKLRVGDEMKWAGIAAASGLLPKQKAIDNLPGRLTAWRAELEKLADEFASGSASVRPKAYPVTCELCRQQFLCRLDAASLDHVDADVDRSSAEAGDDA